MTGDPWAESCDRMSANELLRSGLQRRGPRAWAVVEGKAGDGRADVAALFEQTGRGSADLDVHAPAALQGGRRLTARRGIDRPGTDHRKARRIGTTDGDLGRHGTCAPVRQALVVLVRVTGIGTTHDPQAGIAQAGAKTMQPCPVAIGNRRVIGLEIDRTGQAGERGRAIGGPGRRCLATRRRPACGSRCRRSIRRARCRRRRSAYRR